MSVDDRNNSYKIQYVITCLFLHSLTYSIHILKEVLWLISCSYKVLYCFVLFFNLVPLQKSGMWIYSSNNMHQWLKAKPFLTDGLISYWQVCVFSYTFSDREHFGISLCLTLSATPPRCCEVCLTSVVSTTALVREYLNTCVVRLCLCVAADMQYVFACQAVCVRVTHATLRPWLLSGS